jgi:hypothetical protein
MMHDWHEEEINRMREWDVDALCETLNITSEEIIDHFYERAHKWVKENCSELR